MIHSASHTCGKLRRRHFAQGLEIALTAYAVADGIITRRLRAHIVAAHDVYPAVESDILVVAGTFPPLIEMLLVNTLSRAVLAGYVMKDEVPHIGEY